MRPHHGCFCLQVDCLPFGHLSISRFEIYKLWPNYTISYSSHCIASHLICCQLCLSVYTIQLWPTSVAIKICFVVWLKTPKNYYKNGVRMRYVWNLKICIAANKQQQQLCISLQLQQQNRKKNQKQFINIS